jgi:DUF4097 and DUF4098 domain-containing protein YvlB
MLVSALLLAEPVPTDAQGALVSIRATTAAISVTGGAAEVSAVLYDSTGTEVQGLVVERQASRTSVVLAIPVRPGARIEVRVPSAVDLNVEGSNGGPVTVRGVSGQLEILNSNAGIVLERVGGTVLASTSNGPIEATLRSVDPGLPMSFLTSNGRIDLTFPGNLNATLRMESDTGPLTTDFELARVGGEPIERKVMRGGRLRTIRYGAVNRGGPAIDVRTENAPIVIRRHD